MQLSLVLRTISQTMLRVGVVLLAVCAACVVGPSFESDHYPVAVKWRVDGAIVSGDDLILTGTMVKQRQCDFYAPARATDDAGVHYAITNPSHVAGQSWDDSPLPQRFGPWIVRGGAGKRLHFYLEHRCHPLWTIVSVLGVYGPVLAVPR